MKYTPLLLVSILIFALLLQSNNVSASINNNIDTMNTPPVFSHSSHGSGANNVTISMPISFGDIVVLYIEMDVNVARTVGDNGGNSYTSFKSVNAGGSIFLYGYSTKATNNATQYWVNSAPGKKIVASTYSNAQEIGRNYGTTLTGTTGFTWHFQQTVRVFHVAGFFILTNGPVTLSGDASPVQRDSISNNGSALYLNDAYYSTLFDKTNHPAIQETWSATVGMFAISVAIIPKNTAYYVDGVGNCQTILGSGFNMSYGSETPYRRVGDTILMFMTAPSAGTSIAAISDGGNTYSNFSYAFNFANRKDWIYTAPITTIGPTIFYVNFGTSTTACVTMEIYRGTFSLSNVMFRYPTGIIPSMTESNLHPNDIMAFAMHWINSPGISFEPYSGEQTVTDALAFRVINSGINVSASVIPQNFALRWLDGLNHGTVELMIVILEVPFTPPIIQTLSPSSVSVNSVFLNGKMTIGDLVPVKLGFQVSRNVTFSTILYNITFGNSSATVTYTFFLSLLSQNTTFYYRAWANDSVYWLVGATISFQTLNAYVLNGVNLFDAFLLILFVTVIALFFMAVFWIRRHRGFIG